MSDLLHHCSYFTQILILSVFWVRKLKRKENFILRVVACGVSICACLTLIAIARMFFTQSNWIIFSFPYLAILVLFGVGLGICFDAPIDVILLTLQLPATAQLCASTVGDVIGYLSNWSLGAFYVYDLLSIVVICCVSAPLGRLYERISFYDRDIYRLINTTSYFVVSCILVLNSVSPEIESQFIRYVLVAGYRFLMSTFVFFLIFSMLTVGRMRYQKDMTEVLMKKQEQQFALARDLTELVNIKYHDMKHMESAGVNRAFLEEDSQRLAHYECVVNCGNTALDTTLTEKSIVCKRNQIDFTMMVDGGILDFMIPVDIYALFGNMLDNAIDCLTAFPVEERHLRLRVTAMGSMVSILCENVCHDTLRFENGLPQTVKEDVYNHGFGTKSIAHICEKYHAQFRMSCDGELFVLKILIPTIKGNVEFV